jgi:CMP/dCMP kinase
MHISITGDLGSGKSTVAKEICQKLNYKYLSTGLIQRQLGKERGMNTLEFNKFTDYNKEIDDVIDQKLKDINDQPDPFVLDSRLGWHFVNKSFKIYLMAIDEVAASRVIIDKKRIGEPSAVDIKAKINDQRERRKIEDNRFEKNYGVKPDIFNDFDAIIDTSTASISEVTDLILSLYKKHINNDNYNKIWLSPFRIFPTENIRTIAGEGTKELILNINEKGFDSEFPVMCLLYNNDFYMFDGHKRLSACIYNKLPFIPVLLAGKNDKTIIPSLNVEKFVNDSINKSCYYDWEDVHKFRFFHYPLDNLKDPKIT